MWVVYTLNGLYFAALLFLISLGLNIILGVMGILNLAHGSLYAIGAFIAAWTIITLGTKVPPFFLYISLLSGLVGVGIVGFLMEKSLIRFMYKRTLEYQLLLTFGALMLLEDVIKMIWGGQASYSSAPFELLGKVDIWGQFYPTFFLFVMFIALIAGLCIWLFMSKTKLGIMLRAISLDREMATGLGLDITGLSTFAFVLGSGLAGLAGGLGVPTPPGLLGFGHETPILGFFVVVVGGPVGRGGG